jgi:calcium-dependent protein kinase
MRSVYRAQAIVDDGRPPHVSSLLLQRITVLLQGGDTFHKCADRIFCERAVDNQGFLDAEDSKVLPMSCLGDVFMHWKIPRDHISTFWALMRKQPSVFHEAALPDYISYQDFHDVLLKTLRRLRDMYTPESHAVVSKHKLIRQSTQKFGVAYEVNDSCGKGAFGECTLVTHRKSKTQRVAKRIDCASAKVPIEEIQFELNTLKDLDHPNIVKIFEWFQEDSSYFLVMQAARGGDLRVMLRKVIHDHDKAGLDEPLTANITSQALKALAYVHETKHIVHRDIKPANMLLATPDFDKPKILLADFGVAELFDDQSSHSVKGTVGYMSPEVFENKVGPRVDVWAMGVVVYELLCGERPIKADNPMAMFAKLRSTTIDYKPVQEADASEAAVAFIRQLLQKKVEDRPTASQALEDAWLKQKADHFALQGRQSRKAKQSVVSFTNASHFTKVAMNCIASQMDTSKIEGLTAIFHRFDVDNDGKLSTDELSEGLKEMQIDEDSVKEMVKAVDMDHNGTVEYSEFVAALLSTQGKLVEDVIWHAFDIFDENGDGQISLDELRAMMSEDGPLTAMLPDGKKVDEVLADIDTSRDGVISFSEFRDYIMQGTNNSSDQLDVEEPLRTTMARLAPHVGRPEAELVAQAERLSQQHWLSTIGDVQQLSEAEWTRLGLPLKLERVLRAYISHDGS